MDSRGVKWQPAPAPCTYAPLSPRLRPRPLPWPSAVRTGEGFLCLNPLPSPCLPTSGKTSLFTPIPKPETQGSSWHSSAPSPQSISASGQFHHVDQLSNTPFVLHLHHLHLAHSHPPQSSGKNSSKSKPDDAKTPQCPGLAHEAL